MKEAGKDPLEQFIHNNKESFPKATPSDDLWAKIDAGLPELEKKALPNAVKEKVVQIKVKTIWRAAAVLILGFGIGYLTANWGKDDASNVNPIAAQADSLDTEVVNNYYFSLADLSPELKEVEVYYQGEIDQRMQELEAFDVGNKDLEEMDELKAEYVSLQNEAVSNTNNARVIEAMIDNYKLRLQVLETVLDATKKEKAVNDLPEKTKQDVQG